MSNADTVDVSTEHRSDRLLQSGTRGGMTWWGSLTGKRTSWFLDFALNLSSYPPTLNWRTPETVP